MKLKDAVCVVTGGASGLGEAAVALLAREGAKVSIWDLNDSAGTKLAKKCGEYVIFCKVDVTDEQSVKDAIQETVSRFGGIHVLVNSAGIEQNRQTLGKKGPHSMEMFDRVIKVNVTGTFNTLRLVAHQMSTQPLLPNNERGVIINTASVAGYEAQRGHAAYGASKSAVIAMTLPVARDLAYYNIRVVTVAPGLFLTPMSSKLPEAAMKILTPHSLRLRFGAPEEYASAIKFIAENSYVNGSTLRIDGGMRSPHI